jgi:hypothetical protein
MRKMINVSVGKSEGNRTLKRSRRIQGDNIKTNLNEIVCEGMNGAKNFSSGCSGRFCAQLVSTGQRAGRGGNNEDH